MKFHETRRKIIREWKALPKDKRQTEEQVGAFAKKAVEQNEFPRSRRDPYETIMGWLLPRTGSAGEVASRAVAPDHEPVNVSAKC